MDNDLQIVKNHYKGVVREETLFGAEFLDNRTLYPHWIVNAPSLQHTLKNQLDKFGKNENVIYSPSINVQENHQWHQDV